MKKNLVLAVVLILAFIALYPVQYIELTVEWGPGGHFVVTTMGYLVGQIEHKDPQDSLSYYLSGAFGVFQRTTWLGVNVVLGACVIYLVWRKVKVKENR